MNTIIHGLVLDLGKAVFHPFAGSDKDFSFVRFYEESGRLSACLWEQSSRSLFESAGRLQSVVAELYVMNFDRGDKDSVVFLGRDGREIRDDGSSGENYSVLLDIAVDLGLHIPGLIPT